MVEDGYALILAFALVALAAGGAFLVRRSLLTTEATLQVCPLTTEYVVVYNTIRRRTGVHTMCTPL